MKILRFADEHGVKVGVVKGTFVYTMPGIVSVVEAWQRGFTSGNDESVVGNSGEEEGSGERFSLDEVKVLCPVEKPGKVIAIGLNYMDHCREQKAKVPEAPLVFAKFSSAIIGPEEYICWSRRVTSKVDYEAELAVVIGRPLHYADERTVLSSIVGYTAANDVSARDLQFGDRQWVRGKSLDTFCPIGPVVVTTDEIKQPNNLRISSRVNGELMQSSHTSEMIFPVPFLVSWLSRYFTLDVGDVILTGTPAGVGYFRDPQVLLNDGDVVSIEIEGIGTLNNRCRIVD